MTKPITTRKATTATIYRYRCKECQRTFRDYPIGIDRSSFAPDIRRLAAISWALGLSYRDTVAVFEKFEITLSRSTIWREGKDFRQQLNAQNTHQENRFFIDQTFIHEISPKLGVVIAIDIGTEKPIILGTLNEYNPNMVLAWLKPMVSDTNIKIIVFSSEEFNNFFNHSND